MKSFSILGGKAHVVELPEINGKWQTVYRNDNDKNGVLISDEKEYYDKWGENSNPRFVFDLPPGTWQIVGLMPEVTEEQAATMVKECIDATECTTGYANYNRGDKPKPFCLDTALESLESAIVAERYYLDNNPVPPFNERLNDWIEAQSRVLCRERCLVLRRVDG